MDLRGEANGGMFQVDVSADERIMLLAAILKHGMHGLTTGEMSDLDLPFAITRQIGDQGETLWPRRTLDVLRATTDAEYDKPLLDAALHAGVMSLRAEILGALSDYPMAS